MTKVTMKELLENVQSDQWEDLLITLWTIHHYFPEMTFLEALVSAFDPEFVGGWVEKIKEEENENEEHGIPQIFEAPRSAGETPEEPSEREDLS